VWLFVAPPAVSPILCFIAHSAHACNPAVLQNVSQSDNFYHFTLQLPAPYVASSSSSRPGSGGSSSARPAGRSWVLGCYTNDERREWLEAILNAKLPAKQQVCGRV
jgi:hypothetical protein